nr:carboxylate-amine ligase [Wenxinia marina]
MTEPSFTLGIEEEYLLVDAETLALAEAPPDLMKEAEDELGEQAGPEFLRCQLEVGTKKCADISEAREDLTRLRHAVHRLAGQHGLSPIAASSHPSANWRDQTITKKARYADHARRMQSVAERMLISGMHVHVGLDDDDLRIDLMNQASYFLPHLLALSTSSPYWQGRDSGLNSYRLAVFDNMPRTGLPARFGSWSEYRRAIGLLVNAGEMQDATHIWWDIRPAELFPTLEVRICDICPRLDHAISIAALVQGLMRMLWRLRASNMRWRTYDPFLIMENRWRAQRYGTSEGLIDFGRGAIVSFPQLVEELLELIAPDIESLGSQEEAWRTRDILADGTGADLQRRTYEAAVEDGASHDEALTRVTRALVDVFLPARPDAG